MKQNLKDFRKIYWIKLLKLKIQLDVNLAVLNLHLNNSDQRKESINFSLVR